MITGSPPSLPPSMITADTKEIALSVKARFVSARKLDVYLFDECEKWRESFIAERKRSDILQVSFLQIYFEL